MGSKSNSLRRVWAGVFRSPSCGGARMISTTTTTASVTSPSPWLMLPPALEDGDLVYKFYSLADREVKSYNKRRNNSYSGHEEFPDDDAKFVGSSHGWLALFNQHTNHVFLSNPISGRSIKLPPIHTLPDPEINLEYGVSKLILSCPPEQEECLAMMTFGIGESLAVCAPGRSTAWTPIGDLFYEDRFEYNDGDYLSRDRHARVYSDHVYCSKQKIFTCITEFEIDLKKGWRAGECPTSTVLPPAEFEDWDFLWDPLIPCRTQLLEYGGKKPSWWMKKNNNLKLLGACNQIPHLVYAPDGQQLFLVLRFVIPLAGPDGSLVEKIPFDAVTGLIDVYPYKTAGFSVFRVDEGVLSSVERSLGGLSMFVGVNHSFAVPASECPGVEPDSIYFTEAKQCYRPPGLNVEERMYGGHDIGVFDYVNKTISPCYYPCDVLSFKKIAPPPMWFTPTAHSILTMSTNHKSLNPDDSSSSRFPWLMLSPGDDNNNNNNNNNNFYSLVDKKVKSYAKMNCGDDCALCGLKVVGSSHGWLVLFNEHNRHLFLSNPLTGRRINLPPIHTLPIPQESLDVGYGCVDKVIISCSPDEDDQKEELRVMMIFGRVHRLAFCAPGRSPWWWTPIGSRLDPNTGFARTYDDCVYSSRDKLFFCVTRDGDMESWDLGDPRSPRLDWMTLGESLEFDPIEKKLKKKKVFSYPRYLVCDAHSSDLFYLVRHICPSMRSDGSYARDTFYGLQRGWYLDFPYKTIGFDVYKIARKEGGEGGKAKCMDGHLDGRVMFVGGANQSFAAMSDATRGFPPNTIFFTDREGLLPSKDCNYGGHDNGIFDYEAKTFSALPFYPCDYQSIKRIVPPPVWFLPPAQV